VSQLLVLPLLTVGRVNTPANFHKRKDKAPDGIKEMSLLTEKLFNVDGAYDTYMLKIHKNLHYVLFLIIPYFQ
jgi:hypothetical protein